MPTFDDLLVDSSPSGVTRDNTTGPLKTGVAAVLGTVAEPANANDGNTDNNGKNGNNGTEAATADEAEPTEKSKGVFPSRLPKHEKFELARKLMKEGKMEEADALLRSLEHEAERAARKPRVDELYSPASDSVIEECSKYPGLRGLLNQALKEDRVDTGPMIPAERFEGYLSEVATQLGHAPPAGVAKAQGERMVRWFEHRLHALRVKHVKIFNDALRREAIEAGLAPSSVKYFKMTVLDSDE